MTKNETKGNGPQLPVPQSKAGDELRAHALSLVDQAKSIVRATREQCDSLEQAAEELEQQTIERFELLATAAELQIDKTKAAIGTIRELSSMAATITVHAPDGEGRVFVDVVGKIDDGDFETFKQKTDQIYPIGASHPKKLVIVTLVSYGGAIAPAMQIGELAKEVC
jgi:hypothetical protein